MKDIDKILKQTTFRQVDGTFVYAKLLTVPANPQAHFLIAVDSDEVTVVTRSENYVALDAVERNREDYALFELCVSAPFYSVGFLARVTDVIAAKDANILVVSTYSKDYIMVKVADTELAKTALIDLGMKDAITSEGNT